MSSEIIVIAAGGHGRVLTETLLSAGRKVAAILDLGPNAKDFLGVPILDEESNISKFPPSEFELVVGLGATDVKGLKNRKELIHKFKAAGYRLAQVIHPKAVIAQGVLLGEGVQILAGVVVQNKTRIGHHVIINTGSKIDHDCVIGDFSHIAPGAVLCGGVGVGEFSFVGANSTVIQNIQIGKEALVAAGAAVIKNVPDSARVAGVPAK